MFGMIEAMYQMVNSRLKGLYKWNVQSQKHTAQASNLSTAENNVLVQSGSGWITWLDITFTPSSTVSVTWKVYIDEDSQPIFEETLNISSSTTRSFYPLLFRYRTGYRITVQPSAANVVNVSVRTYVLKDV